MRIQEDDKVVTVKSRRRARTASIAGGILAVALIGGLLAGAWYLGRYQTRLENEHRTAISSLEYGKDRLMNGLKVAKEWWTGVAVNQENKLTSKLDSRFADRAHQKEARLQEHIQNMEFANQSQTDQLKQVQGELADARKEMAALREDNSVLRTQTEQTSRHLREMEQASHKERIDFNLTKYKAQTLAPGISVAVQFTDPAAQRFNGYVKLQNDPQSAAKTVWIRNQEAQVPVSIYTKSGEPIQLVVNQVNKGDVVGYLVMPSGESNSAKPPEQQPDNGKK